MNQWRGKSVISHILRPKTIKIEKLSLKRHQSICSLRAPTDPYFIQNLSINIILFSGTTDPFYLNIKVMIVIIQCFLLDKFRYHDNELITHHITLIRRRRPEVFLRKGVLKNAANLQETPMPKCDFNKVVKQIYWNHIPAWVFFCTFAAYFQNTFLKNTLDDCFCLMVKCLSNSFYEIILSE